ncbi:hypothetical protein [Streptomyces sp. RKAG293]|nr:hypothetical protein [Streptomyces sp. RKAG293]MCM2422674.1 hypothetical protein [Streptomyces sp. RKAG293]
MNDTTAADTAQKVALITGANGGIGSAIVTALFLPTTSSALVRASVS